VPSDTGSARDSGRDILSHTDAASIVDTVSSTANADDVSNH